MGLSTKQRRKKEAERKRQQKRRATLPKIGETLEDPLSGDESEISTWSEGEFDSEFGAGGGVTEQPKPQPRA